MHSTLLSTNLHYLRSGSERERGPLIAFRNCQKGAKKPPCSNRGGDKVILDAPAIDWLTFTTWDELEYKSWQEWQKQLAGDQKTGKIRMYDGIWKGSSFVGEGRQNNKAHGMIRISGSESNNAYFELLRGDYAKCTRVDIQITTPYQLDIQQGFLLMI